MGDKTDDGGAAGKVASAITAANVAWEVLSPLAGPVPTAPDVSPSRDQTTISEQMDTPQEAVASFRDTLADAEAAAGLSEDVGDLADWHGKQQDDRIGALDDAPEEAESAIHSDPPDNAERDLSDDQALDAAAEDAEGDWSDAADLGADSGNAGDAGDWGGDISGDVGSADGGDAAGGAW